MLTSNVPKYIPWGVKWHFTVQSYLVFIAYHIMIIIYCN